MIGQTGDRLYRQNANGTFSAMDLAVLGLSGQAGGFSARWGDYDSDSRPDLFKSRGETGIEDRNAFFRGKADGTFESFAFSAGITEIAEHRGACWLDYNLDGRPDLAVNARTGPPRLYRNIAPRRATTGCGSA